MPTRAQVSWLTVLGLALSSLAGGLPGPAPLSTPAWGASQPTALVPEMPAEPREVPAGEPPGEPAEEAGPVGGFRAGDKVPYFYVRAITGPLSGKSVCYVCRNGDRPVVMVLVRRLIPVLPTLLKQVDEAVDGHRADGLRGFGVFVDKDPRRLLPQVQTLSFNGKLSLPLTIAAAPAEGLGWRGLPDEVAVSVVLYRDQQVLKAFTFRDEAVAGELADLLDAVHELAEGTLKR
ncbi:MAG: hypothetical protein ACKOGA_01585 [Planctomycetaceae bacterium]